jgi:ribosome-associated protein
VAADRAPAGVLSDWVVAAARGADAKTEAETVVLDVGDVLAITTYFVITSGRNARQVRTITEAVEAAVDDVGGPKPLRIEGLDGHQWVLVDYGDFVVHVFNDESREYYELERLWGDMPRLAWRRSLGEAAAR